MSDTTHCQKCGAEYKGVKDAIAHIAGHRVTCVEYLKRELSEARVENAELMRRNKLGADLLVETNRLQEGIVARLEAERDKLQAKLTGILHAADCVLLDPDGRVAIRGSDEDRRILQAAIDAAKEAK